MKETSTAVTFYCDKCGEEIIGPYYWCPNSNGDYLNICKECYNKQDPISLEWSYP